MLGFVFNFLFFSSTTLKKGDTSESFMDLKRIYQVQKIDFEEFSNNYLMIEVPERKLFTKVTVDSMGLLPDIVTLAGGAPPNKKIEEEVMKLWDKLGKSGDAYARSSEGAPGLDLFMHNQLSTYGVQFYRVIDVDPSITVFNEGLHPGSLSNGIIKKAE